MPRRQRRSKQVETLRHDEAKRTNIPTAEYSSAMEDDDRSPIEVAYARRNRDLDPQLVWRGKDEQDLSDLVVQAPPLYIQEKVHPKVLIDDLRRRSDRDEAERATEGYQPDLFSDFNGFPEGADRTDFYEHDANWSNRMILGDSLQVMASLAEREGLRGKVQCIYIDPPYGIKFNSNFQWSTRSREVKDGNVEHITREPEQVKAFRDTWRDEIHSYLSYLRDRLEVARDLLSDSGSVFVQIGDENVHRVRALMDEVFGEAHFISEIVYRTTTGKASAALDSTRDFVLWYGKSAGDLKFRRPLFQRDVQADRNYRFDFLEDGRFVPMTGDAFRLARLNPMTSQSGSATTTVEYEVFGRRFVPGKGGWKTNLVGMQRLDKAQRLTFSGRTLGFVRPFSDFAFQTHADIWDDTRQSGFGDAKVYVVQTASRVIERCILMATDPGDLVLDPTCGSGTTAYVAEQWGRRWITIDTSRVALALTRARIMGARYPYYLLAEVLSDLRAAGQTERGDSAGPDGVLRRLQLPDQEPPAPDEDPALLRERHPFGASLANAKVLAHLIEGWAELGRGDEASEPPHRVVALLDGPMILFACVVHVLMAAMPHRAPDTPPDRLPIRRMPIGGDAQGLPLRDLEEAPEEAARGVFVAVRAQHRIDQRPLPIDGAIQGAPASGDLHRGFVDGPGTAGAATSRKLRVYRRRHSTASSTISVGCWRSLNGGPVRSLQRRPHAWQVNLG